MEQNFYILDRLPDAEPAVCVTALKQTWKPTAPKRVEKNASSRPPNLILASGDLDLTSWP